MGGCDSQACEVLLLGGIQRMSAFCCRQATSLAKTLSHEMDSRI